VCPLQVFWVYNKVAGLGDVVIEKQGFSIVDTHGPAIPMPLSPVLSVLYADRLICMHIEIKHSYKDVIRKYVDSFHLAYITSRKSAVIAGYRCCIYNESDTSTLFYLFLLSLETISFHQQAHNGVPLGSGRLGNGAWSHHESSAPRCHYATKAQVNYGHHDG
jgi:hypothetical protein